MAELERQTDPLVGWIIDLTDGELDTLIFALRTCLIEIECRDLYKSLSKQRDDILCK